MTGRPCASSSQLTDRQGKWGPGPTHWRSASVGGKDEDLLPGAAQLVLVRLRSYHWCGLGAAQVLLVRLRSYYWCGSGAAQLVLVRLRSYHWCGSGAAQLVLVRLRSYHWCGSGAAQLLLVLLRSYHWCCYAAIIGAATQLSLVRLRS